MTVRLRAAVCALAVLVSMALPAAARGLMQDTTARRGGAAPRAAGDTLRAVGDSAGEPSDSIPIRTDTIKAPVARAGTPASLDVGQQYTWTREQLFASGALTLGDVLARIPGITTFRSGWLATPQVAAYNGDVGRTRIFYDDVEVDDLSPRTGGILNLASVQLWTLEDVTVVRAPGELRVYIRSWGVERTTPYTRTDIITGSEQTNLYRAFYGRRFFNGAALQVGAQQFGTRDVRINDGGDAVSLMLRFGVARRYWSVDAFANRTRATRTAQTRLAGGSRLAPFDGTSTLGYARARIGRADGGPFLQLIAASLALRESSPRMDASRAASYGVPPDSADTTRSVAQYIATAGFDALGARIRLTDRVRAFRGATYNSPGGSLEFSSGPLALTSLAERDAFRGVNRVEAGGRLRPLPFVEAVAAAGQSSALSGSGAPGFTTLIPRSRSARAELGVRLWRPWVSAGLLRRDTAFLRAPVVFDSAFKPLYTGPLTGKTLALRGPLAYGFGVDAWAARWPANTPYTPQTEARAELNYGTNWLSRFPRGNFSVSASGALEYRGRVLFPGTSIQRYAGSSKVLSAQLELRILRGFITYQVRNVLGYPYDLVPAFQMPRAVSIYGVRWYFYN